MCSAKYADHCMLLFFIKNTCKMASMLFFLAPIGASVAAAQNLKSSADYAKDENIQALEDIIKEAETTLDALRKPLDEVEPRMQRNRVSAGQPRIVNGRGTIDYPASGAVLKGEDPRSAVAWCSGTLIAPDKFLTAAHCINDDARPEIYHIYLQSAGVFAVIKIDWQQDLYKFPTADIAVLTLEQPVERIVPEAILMEERPIHGTLGTIVGFGRTGGFNYDYGIKREGFVQTAGCPPDRAASPLVCWIFSAEMSAGEIRSNTCNADSGGALFVEEVIGGRRVRKVAGVTSGGEMDDCLIGDQSYNVDVVDYAKWISQISGVEGEPKAAGFAPVLSPRDDVLGETFTLHEQRPKVDVAINVRDGTSTLLIAMNGEDNGQGRNNFDLAVRRAGAVVCNENGDGQFAVCRFDDPEPGTWTVELTRQRGGGRVQAVVTEFRAIEE